MLVCVQIFLYFLLVTNVIVSAQLILGGSAVISALTGRVPFIKLMSAESSGSLICLGPSDIA